MRTTMPQPRPVLAAALVAALALFSSVSHAAVITLDVVADTYLTTAAPDTPQYNDPDDEVIVGNTASGSGQAYHGLIRFDTSSVVVPIGQTIDVTSVILSTLNRNTAGGGSSLTINVYEYGFDFAETTATWNDPAGNGDDPSAGGALGTLFTSASVTTGANDTNAFVSSTAFATAVESAVLGDDTVNLLLTRNTFIDSNTFTRFLSLDSGSPGFQLEVTYDLVPVPEPSGLLLLAAGAVGGVAARRLRSRRP